jgi:hypothetical protein
MAVRAPLPWILDPRAIDSLMIRCHSLSGLLPPESEGLPVDGDFS